MSAVAAGSNAPRFAGWRCISTFCAATAPDAGLWGPCQTRSPASWNQATCTQPAATSVGSKSHRKSAASPSFAGSPVSNGVPEYVASLSRIAASCPLNTSRLDARYFANSSCASAAVRSALPARSCALAAASTAALSSLFDLRRNSVWMRASSLPKASSPTIPKAIAASATAVPHLFHGESYDGWTIASTTSAITATRTSMTQPHSQRAHDASASSSWASLAFIVPSRKRHAGKEFRDGLLGGLAVGALIFGILLVVGLCLQWQL